MSAAQPTQHETEDKCLSEAAPSRRGVLGAAAAVAGLAATQALPGQASALTLEDVTPTIAAAPTLSAM